MTVKSLANIIDLLIFKDDSDLILNAAFILNKEAKWVNLRCTKKRVLGQNSASALIRLRLNVRLCHCFIIKRNQNRMWDDLVLFYYLCYGFSITKNVFSGNLIIVLDLFLYFYNN